MTRPDPYTLIAQLALELAEYLDGDVDNPMTAEQIAGRCRSIAAACEAPACFEGWINVGDSLADSIRVLKLRPRKASR
jgi:hypothetical protein